MLQAEIIKKYRKRLGWFLAAYAIGVVGAAAIGFLVADIGKKKGEARQYPFMLSKLSDEDVSPEVWGKSFPAYLEAYLSMQETDKWTEFGGSAPYSKLIRFPILTKLWAGYPFSLDFNEERSHFYSQIDQRDTKRNDKAWLNAHGLPKFAGQPGACMNCHSGWTPSLIREMGWADFNRTPYVELVKQLESKHGMQRFGASLGSTCADCHAPEDMSLRVTRPAFVKAMELRGYQSDPVHGLVASRQEMRSMVCQQCHVEYYMKKETSELTFPWTHWPRGEPFRVEMLDAYYDEVRAASEHPFKYDWIHKETHAPMIKIQHPETELASSGVHGRSGVACADCHMPYKRSGAIKITEHKIESPLRHVEESCRACHPVDAAELEGRVRYAQRNTARILHDAEGAIVALIDDIVSARKLLAGVPELSAGKSADELQAEIDKVLGEALEAHRRASMRWDLVSSENSMGFHSAQESARVLAQATDLARRGQLQVAAVLAERGIKFRATTGVGQIPAPGTPIPESRPPVGQVPPKELGDLDETLKDVH